MRHKTRTKQTIQTQVCNVSCLFLMFQAKEINGIKILRYEDSVFFLNKEHFRTSLYKHVTKPAKIANNRRKRDRDKNLLGKPEKVICFHFYSITYLSS